MDGNFISDINLSNLLLECKRIRDMNKGTLMTMACWIDDKVEKNSLFLVYNKKTKTIRYLDQINQKCV